jgi:hypothetical protein
MQRIPLLIGMGFLVIAVPAWAQEPELRSPGGTITIPSQRTLEREAVTQPRNEFSTNDATATRQMERQDRQIDREVIKGICTDC